MPSPSQPPLFRQVADAIRERLHDGTYPVGIPLPGERTLAESFGVARITVRSALARLQEEGLVTRLRGQGTLPIGQAMATQHPKLHNGLLDNIVSQGLRTRIQVLSCRKQPCDAEIARLLQLAPGASVLCLRRVRKSSGAPVMYSEVVLPELVGAAIAPQMLEEMSLLTLMEQAGYPFDHGEQELSATIAPAHVALALKIPAGSPLLQVRRVVYDAQKRPIQYLLGYYAPERYQYRMHVSRSGSASKVWISEASVPGPALS